MSVDLICIIANENYLKNLMNCFRKEVFSLENYSGVVWDTHELII